MRTLISRLSMAAGLLVLAGGASAQGTWGLGTNGCTQQAAASGTYGNEFRCGAAGNQATLTAWSNQRGTGDAAQAGSGWANAWLSPQGTGSFGAANRTETINISAPEHSIDNIPTSGLYDFVMVKFDSVVTLDRFGISWGAADSDITVMRWTGSAAPAFGTGASTLAGDGERTLTSTIGAGGWQLVNSYDGVCKDAAGVQLTGASNSCDAAKSTQATGATAGSSYWLISAFNTTMDTTRTWTDANDGFKLSFLSAVSFKCTNTAQTPDAGGNCGSNLTRVPEPGSLALAAISLLGVFGVRRRVAQGDKA